MTRRWRYWLCCGPRSETCELTASYDGRSRQAPCGDCRPEKSGRHRGSKRIEPATLVEALRVAQARCFRRFIKSGFANKAISDASEGDLGAACEVHADPRKRKVDPQRTSRFDTIDGRERATSGRSCEPLPGRRTGAAQCAVGIAALRGDRHPVTWMLPRCRARGRVTGGVIRHP
jgi:hypothetical protein